MKKEEIHDDEERHSLPFPSLEAPQDHSFTNAQRQGPLTTHSTISKRLRLGAAAALEISMSSSRWRLRAWLGDDAGPPALGDDDEVVGPPPPPPFKPDALELVPKMDGPPNDVSIASPGPPSMVSFSSVGSNSIASSASPLVPSRFCRSVG